MTILDLFCPLTEKKLILTDSKLFVKTGLDSFLPSITVCLNYHNPVVSSTILSAKTGQWALSSIMTNWMLRSLQDFTFNSGTLITCVPADPYRELIRGYHLPRLLAKKIASHYDLPFAEIIRKPFTTKAQGKLNRQQRLVNLIGKFELDDSYELSSFENIIVIDDLATTGSTLSESAKTILNIYPNIKITAIAAASN